MAELSSTIEGRRGQSTLAARHTALKRQTRYKQQPSKMHTAAQIVLLWSFAALLMSHLAIALRLLLIAPRRRALFVLVVPPLAPWWARRNGWLMLSYCWLAAVACYGTALLVLLR